MTVVLKLGGSVITEKAAVQSIDHDALARATDAIAGANGANDRDLVLVHGAGSYGHFYADQYGVTRTRGTKNAKQAWTIHDSMRQLNDHVITACHDRDLPALPVRPLSLGARSTSGDLIMDTSIVEEMLGEQFLPVSHGDVITHRDHGVTIISGDELVCRFARDLDATRVGFCTDVPGVLDATDNPIPRISEYESVASQFSEDPATDVTGGMAAKVKTLLDLEIPASIFALDQLAAFLDGDTPGTLIDPPTG